MSGVGTTGQVRQELASSTTRAACPSTKLWATPWWWPGRRWNRRRAQAGEETVSLDIKHSMECQTIDLLCDLDRIESTVELCEEATLLGSTCTSRAC
eukprot:1713069-Heterocapsa_arctica.AAC.1